MRFFLLSLIVLSWFGFCSSMIMYVVSPNNPSNYENMIVLIIAACCFYFLLWIDGFRKP